MNDVTTAGAVDRGVGKTKNQYQFNCTLCVEYLNFFTSLPDSPF